jgi:hypothetical protein
MLINSIIYAVAFAFPYESDSDDSATKFYVVSTGEAISDNNNLVQKVPYIEGKTPIIEAKDVSRPIVEANTPLVDSAVRLREQIARRRDMIEAQDAFRPIAGAITPVVDSAVRLRENIARRRDMNIIESDVNGRFEPAIECPVAEDSSDCADTTGPVSYRTERFRMDPVVMRTDRVLDPVVTRTDQIRMHPRIAQTRLVNLIPRFNTCLQRVSRFCNQVDRPNFLPNLQRNWLSCSNMIQPLSACTQNDNLLRLNRLNDFQVYDFEQE